jgi:hypothetical protein
MSSLDWTLVTDSLASPDVMRGVTQGHTPPAGGGDFVFGINSLSLVDGIVALYATPQPPNTDFNPMTMGGEITGCLQRGVGGGQNGMAAFLFMSHQTTDVGGSCYMLGLADGNPAHIVLRKGIMQLGLPDEAANPTGSSGILRRSTATYAPGTWVQLRLEVVYNLSGDVVINCYENDLSVNDADAPSWVVVPGMEPFIDDGIGVNTGSVPLVGGRAGKGAQLSENVRRCFFDQITLARQT